MRKQKQFCPVSEPLVNRREFRALAADLAIFHMQMNHGSWETPMLK